jgi:hypothetical protein
MDHDLLNQQVGSSINATFTLYPGYDTGRLVLVLFGNKTPYFGLHISNLSDKTVSERPA